MGSVFFINHLNVKTDAVTVGIIVKSRFGIPQQSFDAFCQSVNLDGEVWDFDAAPECFCHCDYSPRRKKLLQGGVCPSQVTMRKQHVKIRGV